MIPEKEKFYRRFQNCPVKFIWAPTPRESEPHQKRSQRELYFLPRGSSRGTIQMKICKIRIPIARPLSEEFSTQTPFRSCYCSLMGQTGQMPGSTCAASKTTSLPKESDLRMYWFTAPAGLGFPAYTVRASQAALSTTLRSSSYYRCKASNPSAPHLVSGRRVQADREDSSRPGHAISITRSA